MTPKVKAASTKRWWDVWVAVFAVITVTLIGARLWATEWTGNLHTLMFLAFFAGLAGLAIGITKFAPMTTAIYSIVYGVYFTVWLLGGTIKENLSWHDRIVNVLGWRLQNAILQFFRGEIVDDPILFLTLMAILLWVISFLSTFFIVRKGVVWPTLVSLVICLFIIGHYDQNQAYNNGFLMVFLFFAFLLVGRVSFLRKKQDWQAEGVHTSTGAKQDFMRILFGLVAILMIIATLIPITAPEVTRYSKFWNKVTKPFRELNNELYTILSADNPTMSLQAVYFGDSLALGSAASIDSNIVMVITPETEELSGYRNYWRTRSYDTYLEERWTSVDEPALEEILLEEFSLSYPDWEFDKAVTYTVTNRLDRMINIYTPGVPIWIDQQVEATLRPLSGNETELIGLDAEPNLREDDTYQVTSRVVVPTVEDLRDSSMDYPDWVLLYLNLPDDFSPEIVALAGEITEGLESNFDKAQAITAYLRKTIEYVQTVPTPPAGVDLLEWFLFDSQTGFCNYYASAEVLMLRSLGIPARLSVGYAQGEYDRETGSYTIRKQDSHTWPEVYFNEYGWIIFEPTASLTSVVYPSIEDSIDSASSSTENDDNDSFFEYRTDQIGFRDRTINNNDTDTQPSNETSEILEAEVINIEKSRSVSKTVIIIGLVMLAVCIVVFVRPGTIKRGINTIPSRLEKYLLKRNLEIPDWLRKWSYSVRMTDTERAFQQIGRSIRRLGEEPLPGQTPQERGEMLVSLLPETQEPVDLILNEYHLDRFSDHILDVDYAKTSARQIRRMTDYALLKRFFQKKGPEDPEDL